MTLLAAVPGLQNAPAQVDSNRTASGIESICPCPVLQHTQVSNLQARLRHPHVNSILAIVAAVEAKDPYTRRHSLNVAIYAEQLAQLLELAPRDVEVIKIAAALHDVGKIAMPDSILTKPGKLAPVEFQLMQEHPAIGAEIIAPVIFLRQEQPLVLHHHEWYDGSGYPSGMYGPEIPLGARILHVADSIDAMLSPRVYKAAYTLQRTLHELEKGIGTQFDPRIAEAAINWLHENGAQPRISVSGGQDSRPS